MIDAYHELVPGCPTAVLASSVRTPELLYRQGDAGMQERDDCNRRGGLLDTALRPSSTCLACVLFRCSVRRSNILPRPLAMYRSLVKV